jgi:hypothetical protein
LEHSKSSIETVANVDLEAGKRDTNATVGWQADVVHDGPQRGSIGCRDRMQLTCDDGGDQPGGSSEHGNFVQEEPNPQCCLWH